MRKHSQEIVAAQELYVPLQTFLSLTSNRHTELHKIKWIIWFFPATVYSYYQRESLLL